MRSTQLDVLAQLLGGDATALLYKKFKYDKQLVDDISVGNYSFERSGLLYITAVLDADKVEPFWTELTKELATLKSEKFSKQELERAKLNIEDGLYRSKETVAGIASKEGHFQFFSGGAQGEENYLKTLHDVDQKQLDELLQGWVYPDRLNVTMLVPEGSTMPDLGKILRANWTSPEKKVTTAQKEATGKIETVDLGDGRRWCSFPTRHCPTPLSIWFWLAATPCSARTSRDSQR